MSMKWWQFWRRIESLNTHEYSYSSHTRHLRDSLHADQVGVSRGHPGYFQVQGRFPDRFAAEHALRTAKIYEHEGKFFVSILIPALKRDEPRQNPPMEVRVFW